MIQEGHLPAKTECYFEYVDIFDYDRTIVAHPWMDQLKGTVLFRLVDTFGTRERCVVLDFGAGTGQMTRLLLPFQNFVVRAADEDPQAKAYFASHPELSAVQFELGRFPADALESHYDAIVVVGVLHHIPKKDRIPLLTYMKRYSKCLVIADEGLLEYGSLEQRREHCRSWYGAVIEESKRRGLVDLAKLEAVSLADDLEADPGTSHDFKESPSLVIEDAIASGWNVSSLDRIGDWDRYKGGMYVLCLASR